MATYTTNEELQHYGVKGMKWGVRKAREPLATSSTRKNYDSAKSNFRMARKAYNDAYNSAHNYSSRHPVSQFTSKKKSAEANRRWDDAIDKANALDKAKSTYKQAKSERKQQINKTYREINKNTKLSDKVLYNDATRKKMAKYMVDNNMTLSEANKRAKSDAIRNTAVILAAYGTVTAAALYASK